jgi:hypothetical protein
MPLDTRGKIAAAEIAFYAPFVGLTTWLVIRYAFRRDAGWFWLLIFCLCELMTLREYFSLKLQIHSAARMTEGALLVAAESNGQVSLYSAAYIMQYSCLFCLLFSALGFIGMAYAIYMSFLFLSLMPCSES